MHLNADEKRHDEYFHMLIRLFETPHIDNMKILKALLYSKDDMLPLVDGATKTRVQISNIKFFFLYVYCTKVLHERITWIWILTQTGQHWSTPKKDCPAAYFRSWHLYWTTACSYSHIQWVPCKARTPIRSGVDPNSRQVNSMEW